MLWQYVRALDTYNPGAYASLYTEDGQFGNIIGKEALANMIIDAATDANPQASLVSAGRSIDVLLRANGEWKIQFRNIASQE